MDYRIREMRKDEHGLLEGFLYECIFIPKGEKPPDRDVLNLPELRVYFSDFGKEDDNCLVAQVDGKVVGAAWARIMNDYGHVDDDTPSIAISLYGEYRGLGIGSTLLSQLLSLLKSKGYKNVSLSVQKENRAVGLYLRAGFKNVRENDEDYIMVKRL